MRDIAVTVFLLACIYAAIKKPWWGVLSLAIFSYMNPHAYAWGFAASFPAYQVLFLVVAAATFTTKDRQPIFMDWRVTAFFMLWAYFFLTTTLAFKPEYAWQKLWDVSKTYIPFIFMLMLITTREKLYYLVVTIAASIGLLAVKGGLFAFATGFSYRVYGPPKTQFAENNAMAIAVLIAVPLVLLWHRETKNVWIKRGTLAAIPFMYASSLSSWSRGALLAMAAMTLVLIWNSKRKYLAIPIVLIGAYVGLQQLPEEWFGRMNTMETYEQDESASNRLETWRDGWEFALRHPLTGAGFEGWRWVTYRDWHSSYVEIFAEHGFLAFGLWLSLMLGSMLNLTKLARKTRRIPNMEWVQNYSYMLRASFVAYMVGTAFLGLSYWDLLYHLVFISVLVKKFAEEELSSYYQNNPELRQPQGYPGGPKQRGTPEFNRYGPTHMNLNR